MGYKTADVNVDVDEIRHFHLRLVEQREQLKLSQTDVHVRLGVSKRTQFQYEKGNTYPDAAYLHGLSALGFDVMYLLTGRRDPDALSNEEQNLIDAYKDAPDHLKRAAFAVLISPYSSDAKNAQTTPGWYRHELMGEEDVRYPEHLEAERAKQPGRDDTAAQPDGESFSPALPKERGRKARGKTPASEESKN